MINLLRIALSALGVAILLAQIIYVDESYLGLHNPILGLMLGFCFLLTPLPILLKYLGVALMLGIPLGCGMVGGSLWVEFVSEGSWAVGFIGGSWLCLHILACKKIDGFLRLRRIFGEMTAGV